MVFGMPSPRHSLFLPAILLCIFSKTVVFAQSARQITESDELKIKNEARNLVEVLQAEYNFFLTSSALERKDQVARLTAPTSTERMFLNDKVIIENDFINREIEGLPNSERDKPVADYFNDLAKEFGMTDNGQEPNGGKYVSISNISVSNVLAMSAQDSLFVKLIFKIAYPGSARNGFVFKDAQRVAEVRVEKEGKVWRGYITAIRYFNPNAEPDDKSRFVSIAENKEKPLYKYADVLNRETKTVSRIPLLKAFLINDLWGLLSDEDQNRKILAQPQFCEVDNFSDDGLAMVCKDGSWGYINREGAIVIDCQYDSAEAFKKGKAKVQLGVMTMTIGVNGKEIK
jgi:hypothetical protein